MNQRICILSFSNIARDGRILRQVEYARRNYQVDVIGYGNWSPPEGVVYHQVYLSKLDTPLSNIFNLAVLLTGRLVNTFYEQLYWRNREYARSLEILVREKYDLIHANDWTALPVAVAAARGTNTKILYDAHEYTPDQYGQYFSGRYLKSPYFIYMLNKYSRGIDTAITVSDGLAELYRKNFGWNAVVVRNAPAYTPFDFSPAAKDLIKLVHHGVAARGRQLEDLIHLMPLLDNRFSLTFILVPSDAHYLSRLKQLSSQVAGDRISFLDPVSPAEITRTLTAYDMGVPVLPPVNLNHLYALPNKFFDYIMAGIGVVVLALPEMKGIVEAHKIGVASNDFSWKNLANALNRLSADEVGSFKRNSLLLAKKFNAEVEMGKLLALYQDLLNVEPMQGK
jgi:glycosyltransferase involved in cell wall biosynthesis